jgi:DNA-directed RNA polymerase
MKLSKDELVLLKLGADRKKKENSNLEKNSLYHLSDFGRWFLGENIGKVSKKIKKILESSSPKVDSFVSCDELAYITISACLNYLQDDTKIFTLAYKIGKLVELEYNAKRIPIFDSSKQTMERILKKDHEYRKLTRQEKIRIGQACIIAFNNTTDYIELYKKNVGARAFNMVSPSEAFYKIQSGVEENALFATPLKRPMESSPVLLDENLIGGYIFDVLSKKPSLTARNREDHIKKIQKRGDIDRVRKVMNKVASVQYLIDDEVFDVAWRMYTNDITTNGVIPPLEKPLKMDKGILGAMTEEEKKEYKKKFHLLKEQNTSIRGQRISVARTLMISKEYQGKEFYFPTFLDSRGRLYYHGDFLNPQGADLSKALLLFAEGKPIEEPFFYFVHGANCYGIKGSYRERYSWIERRHSKIKAVANNPLGKTNMEFWTKAENPWQFLAFCLDYDKFSEDPDNYVSRLRINMDASSSGLQILSLLVRDEENMRRTNVLSNGTEYPSDIYIECADILQRKIKEDLRGNLKEDAEYWIEFFKDKNIRSLVKRIVMTTVYSLSRFGLQKYTEEWVRGYDIHVDLNRMKYLGAKVNEAVTETLDGSKDVMNWIKEAARKLSKKNKDIELLMPSGFVFINYYHKMDSLQIKTKFLGDYYYVRHKGENKNGKIQTSKTVNASVPNLVHAIDATILFSFVESKGQDLRSLSLVHDSIYCLAGDIDTLYVGIRESIINTFTEDLLSNFRQQIEKATALNIPCPPPYKGKKDVSAIQDAPYIYH